MKKTVYIVLISILLLALAGGAWLVDALRHSSDITLEPHRDRRTSRVFIHADPLQVATTR